MALIAAFFEHISCRIDILREERKQIARLHVRQSVATLESDWLEVHTLPALTYSMWDR